MDKRVALGQNIQRFTIADLANQSPDYRRVLWTGEHSQIVIMTIPPGEEIGAEVHEHGDQILTFVSGSDPSTLPARTEIQTKESHTEVVTPKISGTYPLTSAREALAPVETGHALSKVVIVP